MVKQSESAAMLNDLLALSHVPRWVIISQTGRGQSVAEHSHRVACILMELALRLDLKLPYEALVWALVHDGPECWTGDIPGPFKTPGCDAHVTPWYHEFKRLVPAKWRGLMKVADLIETATYIAKWGVGPHAKYAGAKLIQEVDVAARAVADSLNYGPDKMADVATALLLDIHTEVGRRPDPDYGITTPNPALVT